MNYKLTITKSRNSRCFYVQTSYRKDAGEEKDGKKGKDGKKKSKVSTKTVLKLGNEKTIRETYGVEDAEAWAREQVERLRRESKEGKRGVVMELFTDVDMGDGDRVFHGGDIFIEKVCSMLCIPQICDEIGDERRIQFKLRDYLMRMVCCRILHPGSKLSDFVHGSQFIGGKDLKLENFYRSLDIISDNLNRFQGEVFKASLSNIGRETGVIYYDCTNLFFETDSDDDFRRYGHSKENRPNPLVQVGLFMDMEGLPLAMCVTPGNMSEQKTLQPLEEVLAQDFGLSKFVVCTDGGLGSRSNRRYNVTEDRNFITVQSVKKLSEHYQRWALDPAGWRLKPRLLGDTKTRCAKVYDLRKIDKSEFADDTFYKECLTDEKCFKEHLIVTYSYKYDLAQKDLRKNQINRAIVRERRGELDRPKSMNDGRRFFKKEYFDKEWKPTEVNIVDAVDWDLVEEDSLYDGFNALATSLDDDPCSIIRVNSWRWEIEECFREQKNDLDMRPIYVRTPAHISAHLFICFLALLILKVIRKKLGVEAPLPKIRAALAEMKLLQVVGFGYLPSYNPTPLALEIQNKLNIHINKQIMTPAQIRRAYSDARKG